MKAEFTGDYIFFLELDFRGRKLYGKRHYNEGDELDSDIEAFVLDTIEPDEVRVIKVGKFKKVKP